MQIVYMPKAKRELRKIHAKISRRIIKKMRWYAEREEKALSFAKRLTKPRYGTYRFEIGDYRVIFDIDHDTKPSTIVVFAVRHRSKAYDDV